MYYPGYECSEQDNGYYTCESTWWTGSDCYMWGSQAYCYNWDYNYAYYDPADFSDYYESSDVMDYPGYECTQQDNGMYACENDWWTGSDCGMWAGWGYCNDWEYNYFYFDYDYSYNYTSSSDVMDYPGYDCSVQSNGYYSCESDWWLGGDCYMWNGNPYCADWDYKYSYSVNSASQMEYPGYECRETEW